MVALKTNLKHSPTLRAGWRPLSNSASFFMIFPTPGNTAWSSNTSHNIRVFCCLISCSALEKLNFGEQTSKLSIILTFCSHSAAFLEEKNTWINFYFKYILIRQSGFKNNTTNYNRTLRADNRNTRISVIGSGTEIPLNTSSKNRSMIHAWNVHLVQHTRNHLILFQLAWKIFVNTSL